jgi:hypothetical protein
VSIVRRISGMFMALAVAASLIIGTGSASASPVSPDGPAISGPVYLFIDNYGQNLNGALIDTGHNNIAGTATVNTGYDPERWQLYNTGTSGWYYICNPYDGLCLNEASNSWIYNESNTGTTTEQWHPVDVSGNTSAWQNRHFGTQVMTADSFNIEAQVHGVEGGLSGYNDWEALCVSNC